MAPLYLKSFTIRQTVPDAKTLLFVALAAVALVFCAAWQRSARRSRERAQPGPIALAIGFVTNFFDTLGIGSFAPTTSIWKLKGIVRDEQIPGTLNVGHALPTIAQAFIFIAIVQVEMTTLIGMIAASIAGAWLGAGVVAAWPR
ncbi:MAG TPA: TSUP family transporter, partial [Thermoanaerobaculia bacterium]